MARCVLGIDIGTSGCKAILLDGSGALLASATAEYPLSQPRPGWSEQDPADWYAGVCRALKPVMEAGAAHEIMGLSLSGQMHGMVALSDAMEVVRPAILWNDQRTEAQCAEITQRAGGLAGLLKQTNNMMLTGYTGGKILWMKQNEPENYARTRLILNPKDYIRYLLTGEIVTEVSDASGTGLFDVRNRTWATALIENIGLSPAFFPPCVESTAQTGVISARAAAETGLMAGTPVYGGGGDAVISTTGSGLAVPGRVGVTLGTSGIVAVGLPGYADNPEGKLQLFCNNAPGSWMAFGCTLAAAGSYQWFRNALGGEEMAAQRAGGEDAYVLLNAKAAEVGPGSDGLLYLPYLTGERCPLFDAKARGGFIGLTSVMHKGHFARAVMEGVCFSLKQVYDLIASCTTLHSNEIVVSGGGAKSPLWKQILADVFQLPVKTVYGGAEGGAFGAALVAGAGCGLWPDLQAAMGAARPMDETKYSAENAAAYAKAYKAYTGMYGALKWYTDSLA